mgnify:CR=1 FL=1
MLRLLNTERVVRHAEIPVLVVKEAIEDFERLDKENRKIREDLFSQILPFKILTKIATKSPKAVQKVINCVTDYFDKNKNGMETEIIEFGSSFESDDFVKGTTAFLNKERPNFRS